MKYIWTIYQYSIYPVTFADIQIQNSTHNDQVKANKYLIWAPNYQDLILTRWSVGDLVGGSKDSSRW